MTQGDSHILNLVNLISRPTSQWQLSSDPFKFGFENCQIVKHTLFQKYSGLFIQVHSAS